MLGLKKSQVESCCCLPSRRPTGNSFRLSGSRCLPINNDEMRLLCEDAGGAGQEAPRPEHDTPLPAATRQGAEEGHEGLTSTGGKEVQSGDRQGPGESEGRGHGGQASPLSFKPRSQSSCLPPLLASISASSHSRRHHLEPTACRACDWARKPPLLQPILPSQRGPSWM